MEKVLFFYSVLLIALCAAAVSPAGILYLRTKKKQYLYLILLFTCYLTELTELHYIVFVGLPTGLISSGDLSHISYPALRIGISAAILLLDHRTEMEKHLWAYHSAHAWDLYLSGVPAPD